MKTLFYPTQQIVENYLKLNFTNPTISLSNPIRVLGNLVGTPTTHGNFCALRGVSVNIITGIDIPILVRNNQARKTEGTVMIIEQDPLRNDKDPNLGPFSPFKNPIIGTPNALHFNPIAYPNSKIYRKIVDYILSGKHDGYYNAYLTDANKIYTPYGKNDNPIKRYRQDVQAQTLLADEIRIINPKVILLVGNTAQYAFNNLPSPLNSISSIAIPHFAARASSWTKQPYSVNPATNQNKYIYVTSQLQRFGI